MSESAQEDDLQRAWERLRHNADQGREPRLLPSRLGHRRVSFGALLEQVEREFMEEHADSGLLKDAETTTARLRLLLPVVDYVLSVESIQLNRDDKAALMSAAYSNLFGYGPLDSLFLDDRVTTISLEGVDRAFVRYGHGDLESVGPIFDDETYLRRILRRLLLDAGADLYEGQPFIETGLRVDGRPVCVNLTTPVLSFGYHADIRVHPRQSILLDDLVQSGFMTAQAAELLQAIMQSGYGVVVVGDSESGKTTLLNALTYLLPNPAETLVIERAGELQPPEQMRRSKVRWPSEEEAGATFGEQIGKALAAQPESMILDEVRSDEPETIGPLLRDREAPRQIWSFRGPFDAKRLRNALSMLARRADMSQSEVMVQAMYQRLPFVVTVWRAHGNLSLYSIGEWQYRDSDYPDYILLMHTQEGRLHLTGERPARALNVLDDFWRR